MFRTLFQPRLLGALALLVLAGCDSATAPDPTPGPGGNGLVTATVPEAAPFDANTATVDLADGLQISARTADGRYILVATSNTTPGTTTALNIQGTVSGTSQATRRRVPRSWPSRRAR